MGNVCCTAYYWCNFLSILVSLLSPFLFFILSSYRCMGNVCCIAYRGSNFPSLFVDHLRLPSHDLTSHLAYPYAGEATAVLVLGWEGGYGTVCGKVTGNDTMNQEANTTTSSSNSAGVCMLVKPEAIYLRKKNRLLYLSIGNTYLEAGEYKARVLCVCLCVCVWVWVCLCLDLKRIRDWKKIDVAYHLNSEATGH